MRHFGLVCAGAVVSCTLGICGTPFAQCPPPFAVPPPPYFGQVSVSVSVLDPPAEELVTPDWLPIAIGGLVRWRNLGTVPHDFVHTEGLFATGPLAPPALGEYEGGDFCLVFDWVKESTMFPFYCAIHPGSNEYGVIWVAPEGELASVEGGPAAGSPMVLEEIRPNPARTGSIIAFEIPPPGGPVQLAVYDARGRAVRSLVRETLRAGRHEIVWEGDGDSREQLPAGVYFYRLGYAGHQIEKRAILAR